MSAAAEQLSSAISHVPISAAAKVWCGCRQVSLEQTAAGRVGVGEECRELQLQWVIAWQNGCAKWMLLHLPIYVQTLP